MLQHLPHGMGGVGLATLIGNQAEGVHLGSRSPGYPYCSRCYNSITFTRITGGSKGAIGVE